MVESDKEIAVSDVVSDHFPPPVDARNCWPYPDERLRWDAWCVPGPES